MKLDQILAFLREVAPEESAYENDPVGLHIEPGLAEITSVAVCLDATLPIARQAIESGAQLVVAHHPLIYHPLRRLDAQIPSAAVAMALVRAQAGLYAMHTNWDAAEGGINDTLAQKLGLANIRRLADHGPASIARIGDLEKAMPLGELAALVNERLECRGTSALRRLAGRPPDETQIRRIAVCGGAGAFLVPEAIEKKADAFVTSDVRHHEFLDAGAAGLALIDAGHEATETPGMRALADRIAARFPKLSVSFLPDVP
ncbi:MAG TPA: Nif3-like dinuclear metal center hexameric protein [Capsulimonadaceae bacterium]|nr:Nif3-like dinuclear metal center hexameric protein [Capsulimonadaceae bacterium]